jgi:hypothetical protein
MRTMEHKDATWFRDFNVSNSVGAWFRIPAARGARALSHLGTLLKQRGRRESRAPIAPVGPVQ